MSKMFTFTNPLTLQSCFYLYLLVTVLCLLKYLLMDLIRVFQPIKGPVIRENVFDLKDAKCFQEPLILKDDPADKHKAKIVELEELVAKLREENCELQKTVRENDESKTNLTGVIVGYENMLEKLLEEHHLVIGERDIAKTHLANLELAFRDLVEKYERAKTIINGFESNEKSFREHLANYERAIETIEKKYTDFKNYAVEKLNEANQILKKNDKEYMQEVAKLKAKIIQSQIKINELERQVTRMFTKNGSDAINNNFIFEPLVNNIS